MSYLFPSMIQLLRQQCLTEVKRKIGQQYISDDFIIAISSVTLKSNLFQNKTKKFYFEIKAISAAIKFKKSCNTIVVLPLLFCFFVSSGKAKMRGLLFTYRDDFFLIWLFFSCHPHGFCSKTKVL